MLDKEESKECNRAALDQTSEKNSPRVLVNYVESLDSNTYISDQKPSNLDVVKEEFPKKPADSSNFLLTLDEGAGGSLLRRILFLGMMYLICAEGEVKPDHAENSDNSAKRLRASNTASSLAAALLTDDSEIITDRAAAILRAKVILRLHNVRKKRL